MGENHEGVDIPVVHIIGIRHTLVRIGPVIDVAGTRETRRTRTRVSKEIALAVSLLEGERHVDCAVIGGFGIQRGNSFVEVNYLTRSVQCTRSVCICSPAMESKTFHQTRFANGHGSLTVHRVLVGNGVTYTAVVVVVNMPVRVGGHKLQVAIRIGTVNVDTCPTVAVNNTSAAYDRHVCTAYHFTPAGNICARVRLAELRAGEHRGFDGQGSPLRGDMPHLLTRPGRVVGIRNQTDVTSCVCAQEVSTGLELHTQVLNAGLGRVNHHLSVRTARSLKTQIVNLQRVDILELGVECVTSVRMAILVLITYVEIRTVRLRNKHIIRKVVLGVTQPLHTLQTVNGVDLLLCGVRCRRYGKVFVVLFKILLVVCEEIRIRTGRSNRLVQHVQTENRTLGRLVLVVCKCIHRLTGFGCLGIAAVLVFRQLGIEANHRSIGVRQRSVASRDIEPIHFAVRHA